MFLNALTYCSLDAFTGAHVPAFQHLLHQGTPEVANAIQVPWSHRLVCTQILGHRSTHAKMCTMHTRPRSRRCASTIDRVFFVEYKPRQSHLCYFSAYVWSAEPPLYTPISLFMVYASTYVASKTVLGARRQVVCAWATAATTPKTLSAHFFKTVTFIWYIYMVTVYLFLCNCWHKCYNMPRIIKLMKTTP